jgi:hypothetical protein
MPAPPNTRLEAEQLREFRILQEMQEHAERNWLNRASEHLRTLRRMYEDRYGKDAHASARRP